MRSNGRRDATADHRQESDARREHLLARLPLKERIRELNGVSTAVLEAGEGPPLVLLHGAGEFAAVWLNVVPELSRTHRLIIPDLPGQGASQIIGGRPYDADDVLQWLTELIGDACPSRPIVAGHLLGGAVAARWASRHPDRLDHLVLVDTLGLSWYRPAPSFALPMAVFLARPTPATRDRLFRQCFLNRDQVRQETGTVWAMLMDYALDRARTPSVQAAIRRQTAQLGVRPIPHEELALIAVPTTVIHGRHDLQVRLDTVERAAARHGWTVHVIEDCRDDPAAEQPARLVEIIEQLTGSTESEGAER